MIAAASRHALAARIRGIVAGQDHGVIEATARRLGVSEVSLRMSVDELDPYPTVDVVFAIIRQHGVDPTWLLTGEYDATTHRSAIEDEANFAASKLGSVIAKHLTPDGTPTQPATLRLEA